MTKRKTIAIALIMIISYLFCLCTVAYASDTETNTVSVSAASISQNSGSVEISLSNSADVYGGSFFVEFDSTLLRFSHSYANRATCTTKLHSDGRLKVSFASAEELTDGAFLTLYFEALDVGKSEIKVTEQLLYNGNGEKLASNASSAECVTYFAANSFRLSKNEVKIPVGATEKIELITEPYGSSIQGRVMWSSYDESIATVDQNGVITAKSVGFTQIECNIEYYGSFFCSVTVADKSFIKVDGLSVMNGGEAVLKVNLISNETLTAGSFNIVYDSSMLELVGTTKGTLLNSCASTVNEAYAENALRVNFASSIALEASGEALELRFKVLADKGYATVSIENVVMYGGDRNKIDYAVINGGVRMLSDSTVYINGSSNAEGTAESGICVDPYKPFELTVEMKLENSISSGSFDIVYDKESFEITEAVAGKALDGILANINNKPDDGKVRVSFAGASEITGEGILVKLTLLPKTATFNSEIKLENIKLYDANVNAMTALAENIQVVSGTHKHDYSTSVVAPTCTEKGYTAHTCIYCFDTYNDQELDALGHDEVAYGAKEATCTEAGYNAYVGCTRCDYSTREEIPAIGHDEVYHEGKDPTETEAGYKPYVTCTRCDYTTYEELAPHIHKTSTAVIENMVSATCEENGSYDSVVYCSTCKMEMRRTVNTLKALGHSEVKHAAKQATCEEGGHNAYVTCRRCSYTTYEEIAALGHDETAHEAKEATCTEKGNNAYVECSRCDYSTYEEIPELGHDEIAHEAEVPTCTESGYDAYVECSRCDYTTYKEIAALGHNEVYHEGKEPTETEAGYKPYVECTRCDYTTYEEIAPHKHTAAEPVVENRVEPDCLKDGSYDTVVYCSFCKNEMSRESHKIAALGHDEIQHEAKQASCTEKGHKSYEECLRCDYSTYEEIAALGHDTIKYEAKQATCTENGHNAYAECLRCDYTTYKEIPMLKHSYTHEKSAPEYLKSEATCTERAVYYKSCECGEKGSATFEHGELAPHDFIELRSNADNHWYKCKNCEATDEKAAHEYGDDNICDICKHEKAEVTEKPTEPLESTDAPKPTDTQKPTEEEKETTASTVTEATATTAAKSGGFMSCKSSVTATSAVLLAVMAVGFGIAMRKKED